MEYICGPALYIADDDLITFDMAVAICMHMKGCAKYLWLCMHACSMDIEIQLAIFTRVYSEWARAMN